MMISGPFAEKVVDLNDDFIKPETSWLICTAAVWIFAIEHRS